MLKKSFNFLALLLLAIVLTGGCVPKPDKQSGTVNKDQTDNPTADTVNPASGAYTVNELFSMNKPMKCSWKDNATDKEVTNIIYLNGKKMYQDVNMGDVGHSYMISDGEWLYMWNDFSPMASKMKATEIATDITPPPGKEKDTTGLNQKRDFICEKWAADNSIFNPPQDKNFKDITEEMNQAVTELQEGGGLDKMKQQICDMCRKAPSQELIDQCLESSECN